VHRPCTGEAVDVVGGSVLTPEPVIKLAGELQTSIEAVRQVRASDNRQSCVTGSLPEREPLTLYVSTDAQDLTSRLAQLKATGCERVLREKISRPPRSPFTVHQQQPRDGRRPDVPAGACAPQRAPWT
jgi:hypothetical protein